MGIEAENGMDAVPLECDINIAVYGPFWVEVANPEHPFTAMLITRSRGTCLIGSFWHTISIIVSKWQPWWADVPSSVNKGVGFCKSLSPSPCRFSRRHRHPPPFY